MKFQSTISTRPFQKTKSKLAIWPPKRWITSPFLRKIRHLVHHFVLVNDQVPLNEMTRHLVRMRLASSPACEVTSNQKWCGQNLDATPQGAARSRTLPFCRWLTKRNEVVTDRLRMEGSPTNRPVVSPPYITMVSLSSAHIDPHPSFTAYIWIEPAAYLGISMRRSIINLVDEPIHLFKSQSPSAMLDARSSAVEGLGRQRSAQQVDSGSLHSWFAYWLTSCLVLTSRMS